MMCVFFILQLKNNNKKKSPAAGVTQCFQQRPTITEVAQKMLSEGESAEATPSYLTSIQ